MKNKNFLTFAFLGLSVCALGLLVWAAEPQCQKPNPSTKACYDPDDVINACEELTHGECVSNNSFEYEKKQFPDGTVQADAGVTKTESTKCWRRRGCQWNANIEKCEAVAQWMAWRYKEKTVANPDVTCPSE